MNLCFWSLSPNLSAETVLPSKLSSVTHQFWLDFPVGARCLASAGLSPAALTLRDRKDLMSIHIKYLGSSQPPMIPEILKISISLGSPYWIYVTRQIQTGSRGFSEDFSEIDEFTGKPGIKMSWNPDIWGLIGIERLRTYASSLYLLPHSPNPWGISFFPEA